MLSSARWRSRVMPFISPCLSLAGPRRLPARLLRRVQHGLRMRVGGILIDACFDLMTEMRYQALDRPGRGIAERADRMALDLLGDVEQHVDLALLGAALDH